MRSNPNIFAYPTESFYALGVPATNAKAIRQLFRLKRREKGKPIALIAADIQQVKKFFFMSKDEERLAKKYWPGAVTILLKPKRTIAVSALLGGTSPTPLLNRRRGQLRIGVRVPAHPGARRLAKTLGAPITATSANISGQPPTKSARKVKQSFPGILIMPGRCGKLRQPSTIIKMKKKKILILRQGSQNLSSKGTRILGNTIHPVRSSSE